MELPQTVIQKNAIATFETTYSFDSRIFSYVYSLL